MSVANNAGHNAENTMIDAESQKKTQGYNGNGNGYGGYQDGAGFTGGNNVSRSELLRPCFWRCPASDNLHQPLLPVVIRPTMTFLQ